jgi:hypothetical protein
MNAENGMAKDVLASLKSGVLLKGTVRSHSTNGEMSIAWITIKLPVVGERQVRVVDESNLQSGQQVIIECVPNPLKPERYMFRMVEVSKPNLTAASTSQVPRPKNCVQRRSKFTLRRRVASKR